MGAALMKKKGGDQNAVAGENIVGVAAENDELNAATQQKGGRTGSSEER